MKTLLVLRHAKSSWKNALLDDFDRPLNERGLHDAPRMGALILTLHLTPSIILSSPAVRALATAEQIAESCHYKGEILLRPDFYLAGAPVYLAALSELDDSYDSVMIVGHNPGLEELVTALTGVEERLPTAALAKVSLPIGHWSDLTARLRGELVHTWRPKELV